ncbi:MAG: peptide ABC transporter substrate-binding protein [Planctomycetes bacterium]|nr:peptide ABC transporter substrate-binding protein [Planctomycetota bacterium]
MRGRIVLSLIVVASAWVSPVPAQQENGGESSRHEYLLTYDWDWDPWERDGELADEQVLRFNNAAEPETLDPAIMTGVPEHRLAGAIFEGLCTLDPKNLKARPGMAERWEISDDGLAYTFHLRRDAKWTNGDPVTSEDFRWSWIRALDPDTGSRYADQFYYIDGAEAFNTDPKMADGKIDDFGRVGISAPDPYTFVVKLRAPTPFFMELIAFETLMPVHRATVEKHKKAWIKPENIVTNGAFRLKAWLPRERIALVKSESYWDASHVVLEEIHALAQEDHGIAYNKFLAEEVDWILAIPTARIEEVRQNFDYYVVPYLGSYFYRFNITRKPFDDVRVRKAFSMSVDREELVRNVLKAGQIPTTGFVPTSIEEYLPYKGVEGYGFDPDAAKRLLAEAGYEGGKGLPEIELLYNTDEGHKLVAEFIVAKWREHLGVNVKLRNTEWKVYLDLTHNMDYTISRAGWIGDYVDPNTFVDMFCTGRGNNNTGWSNKTYDDLVLSANRELDRDKRFALFRQAESILVRDDLPILPIYFYVNQGCLREKV